MSAIYKQASSVMIWLGCESDDSKEALDFISLSQPHVTINYGQYLRKIEAVLRLCNRPYWRRLWIIQEVILAKNAVIHCGKDSASWDDFSKFRVRWDERIGMGFARSHFADIRKNLAFDLDRYRLRQSQLRQASFKDLLRAFEASRCSDIRDKVYGLAALAADGEKLRIDYSKSVFDVFADMLSLQPKKESASLVGFARFLQRVLEINPLGNIPDSKSLAMDGVELLGREGSKILLLGPLLEEFNPPQQEVELEAPIENVLNDPLWKVGNLLALKATCRIRRKVIVIHSPVSYGHPYRIPFASSSSSTYSRIDPPMTRSKQLIEERTADEYVAATPRFFLDSIGNIGLVPSNARVGDTICYFDNSNVLAVLRWSGDRDIFAGRAVFLELRNNQACFVVPAKYRFGGQIEFYMNSHTIYLLTI